MAGDHRLSTRSRAANANLIFAIAISVLSHWAVGELFPWTTGGGLTTTRSSLQVVLATRNADSTSQETDSGPAVANKPIADVETEASAPQGLPRYYSPSEVEQRAKIRQPVSIPIPAELPNAHWSDGKIKARIIVDALGHIDAVEILSSDLSPAYEAAVTAAFRAAVARPAVLDGHTVPSWIDVEVVYTNEP